MINIVSPPELLEQVLLIAQDFETLKNYYAIHKPIFNNGARWLISDNPKTGVMFKENGAIGNTRFKETYFNNTFETLEDAMAVFEFWHGGGYKIVPGMSYSCSHKGLLGVKIKILEVNTADDEILVQKTWPNGFVDREEWTLSIMPERFKKGELTFL